MSNVQTISTLCNVGDRVLCSILNKPNYGTIQKIVSESKVRIKVDNMPGVVNFKLKDILIITK
ncbi:hypothetical protein [Aureibacter tunicatorum]|uniref:Uncharacterized protein n=1 Tax=Aureibacter tunicatorum TaxID=866807 RepID=A0AAE3XQW9_9BACT|nr:hypothetical protein [Aureibacter tunicatorum]MDR6240952.1 hypothetical protein [Aureibacter tunicatorum]BDD03732.1 hypothetical protein AUTU_12150 [Aureibacter tunicatorum]